MAHSSWKATAALRVDGSRSPGHPAALFESGILRRIAKSIPRRGHSACRFGRARFYGLDLYSLATSRTHCPFKGDASYFTIKLWDGKVEDVAWSDEQPCDEHGALAGRIAFDADRIPDLQFVSMGRVRT